jgi:hypothetical protein
LPEAKPVAAADAETGAYIVRTVPVISSLVGNATVLEAIADMVIEEATLRKGVSERVIGLGRNPQVIIASAARHKPYGEYPGLRIVLAFADRGRGHVSASDELHRLGVYCKPSFLHDESLALGTSGGQPHIGAITRLDPKIPEQQGLTIGTNSQPS